MLINLIFNQSNLILNLSMLIIYCLDMLFIGKEIETISLDNVVEVSV